MCESADAAGGTGVTLAGVTLAGVTLAGVALAGVALAGVALAGVTLAGVTLAGVTLRVTRRYVLSTTGPRATPTPACAVSPRGVRRTI
jgi:hypothetical protein